MLEAKLTNYHFENDKFQGFYNELVEDIVKNRIILPSIPDVVFKIKQAVNDPKTDLNTLVGVLSSDAAMSARILKVANSALYKRSNDDSDNLRAAVSRLGTSLINALVTNLAIIQTLRTQTGPIAKHLTELFQHSTKVASYCFALAKCFTKINPEQALLAGMVHDIGYLPILQKAFTTRLIWENETYLNKLLKELHAPIGGVVLQQWGFNAELTDAAIKHENIFYTSPLGADLVDLVIVSDFLTQDHDHKNAMDTNDIPAFNQLGLTSLEDLKNNDDFTSLVTEANSLFNL